MPYRSFSREPSNKAEASNCRHGYFEDVPLVNLVMIFDKGDDNRRCYVVEAFLAHELSWYVLSSGS